MPLSLSANVKEVVIGVVGVTGSGKSSFIKRVTEKDIRISTDTESVTQKIEHYSFQSGGVNYVLVDTPGFDDSQRDDEEVFRDLAHWLEKTFRKGQLLNGLLYLQPINTPRQRGSQIRNLLMFKKLCGEDNFQNIILGLSFCDMEAEATIRSRQQELTDTWEWWGEMIDKGSSIERIPYQRDDCIRLLTQFAAEFKITLKVQEEIVQQGLSVDDTEAAKTIAHREELMQIRAEEARQFADLEAVYARKMQQASEAYENTLNLERERFKIQHQRLQLQEQSYSQSFRRQEELNRKVKNLQASNAAKEQASRREIADLQEQLRQINLRNDRRDGEAAYLKAYPIMLQRASRVRAQWEFIKSRRNALRVKQPYTNYEAVDGFSAEDTTGAIVQSFCDRCMKSYSYSEEHFECQKCNESDHTMFDEQTGGFFETRIDVCGSCKSIGKGCFLHGQTSLEATTKWKNALVALKKCPRDNVDQLPYLTCDSCSKDMRDDSLYLHCCKCDENHDLCIQCWGKWRATCNNRYHELHVISQCPTSMAVVT